MVEPHTARTVLSNAKIAVVEVSGRDEHVDGASAIFLPAHVTHGAVSVVFCVRATHLTLPHPSAPSHVRPTMMCKHGSPSYEKGWLWLLLLLLPPLRVAPRLGPGACGRQGPPHSTSNLFFLVFSCTRQRPAVLETQDMHFKMHINM